MNSTNNLSNKYRGCLVGLACGDYLGMPVEFLPTREKIIEVFGSEEVRPMDVIRGNEVKPAGYYTDDTAQAICLAESLIEKGFDIEDQFIRYKKWAYEGYATPDGSRAFGIGQNTARILRSQKLDELPTKLKDNPKAGGNGALMRTAPIGLMYFNDPKLLKDKSIQSAIITHNNEVSAWSCVILNFLIAYAVKGINKDLMIDKLLDESLVEMPVILHDLLNQDIKLIDPNKLENSGWSYNTLNIALYSFFTTDSFNDAINKAIFIGGDTDSQGAVTGALTGAYYGYNAIPEEWKRKLMRREEIEELGEMILKKSA